MHCTRVISVALVAACLVVAVSAYADNKIGIGISAGVEVDPEPGFGGVLNVNFQYQTSTGMLEIGPIAIWETYSKTLEWNNIETYQQTGNASVYAVLVDWVWNYTANKVAPFFILGSGFGYANIAYTNIYSDHTSDHTDSASAVSFNGGLGFTFGSGFEVRALVTAYVAFTEDVSVLPVLLIMGGYHFSL